MTEQEAKNKFEKLIEINEHYGNGDNIELFSKAIEALEKQIPKTPIHDSFVCIEAWACPTCKKHLKVINQNKIEFDFLAKYCYLCGQRLK